ncbi:hypothetical protein [Shouchella patagoniensis]|uniref:hypothetical protein n=1 Tax=Shouchella patagoniensis TaxID=228576 RepID=UPI0009958193|nr:hypothetical protein [Shouchella patagoniensis]
MELARKDPQFSSKFQRFLSETGTLPVEQLVAIHLQETLSEPAFWKASMENVVADIDRFFTNHELHSTPKE